MKTANYSIKFGRILSVVVLLEALPACDQQHPQSAPRDKSASESELKLDMVSPEPLYSPAGREYLGPAENRASTSLKSLEMDRELNLLEEKERLEKRKETNWNKERKQEAPKPLPTYTPAGREFSAPLPTPPSGPVDPPTP